MRFQLFHSIAMAALAQAIERQCELHEDSSTDIVEWARFEAYMLGLPSYAADFVLDHCPLWAHFGYSGEEPFAASDWVERVCENAAVVRHEESRRRFSAYMRDLLGPPKPGTNLSSITEIAKKIYSSEAVGDASELKHPLLGLMSLPRYEVKGA